MEDLNNQESKLNEDLASVLRSNTELLGKLIEALHEDIKSRAAEQKATQDNTRALDDVKSAQIEATKAVKHNSDVHVDVISKAAAATPNINVTQDVSDATASAAKDTAKKTSKQEEEVFAKSAKVSSPQVEALKKAEPWIFEKNNPNNPFAYIDTDRKHHRAEAASLSRIRAGKATDADMDVLRKGFFDKYKSEGASSFTASIRAGYSAKKLINSTVTPSAVLSKSLMSMGTSIAKLIPGWGQLTAVMIDGFRKVFKFLWDGFSEFYGFKALKEGVATYAKLRLLTSSLGSQFSLGTLSTENIRESWMTARMMGFSGATAAWGNELAKAINEGLYSNASSRMYERSALDMFMVKQGFGVDISADRYGAMFRANGGDLNLVRIMNDLRSVSMLNSYNGMSAGFNNMHKLFEALAENVLKTDDNFRSMNANMAPFASLLAKSSVSLKELSSVVSGTQSTTLQHRFMAAAFLDNADLPGSSEAQIALSRRDPAALLRQYARSFSKFLASTGLNDGTARSQMIARELLGNFGPLKGLERIPNLIQVIHELASGKSSALTQQALNTVQDEKEIMNNQLRGIDSLVNTTKHIQAWLFTSGGKGSFTAAINKLFSKNAQELAEGLGIIPNMSESDMKGVNKELITSLRPSLNRLSDSLDKNTASNEAKTAFTNQEPIYPGGQIA